MSFLVTFASPLLGQLPLLLAALSVLRHCRPPRFHSPPPSTYRFVAASMSSIQFMSARVFHSVSIFLLFTFHAVRPILGDSTEYILLKFLKCGLSAKWHKSHELNTTADNNMEPKPEVQRNSLRTVVTVTKVDILQIFKPIFVFSINYAHRYSYRYQFIYIEHEDESQSWAMIEMKIKMAAANSNWWPSNRRLL